MAVNPGSTVKVTISQFHPWPTVVQKHKLSKWLSAPEAILKNFPNSWASSLLMSDRNIKGLEFSGDNFLLDQRRWIIKARIFQPSYKSFKKQESIIAVISLKSYIEQSMV